MSEKKSEGQIMTELINKGGASSHLTGIKPVEEHPVNVIPISRHPKYKDNTKSPRGKKKL